MTLLRGIGLEHVNPYDIRRLYLDLPSKRRDLGRRSGPKIIFCLHNASEQEGSFGGPLIRQPSPILL
jgi:hypothetical protein